MLHCSKLKGFTLIELMIVVAIIGILAAVAIPAYSHYLARGKVSEAVVLYSGMKTALEEHIAVYGTFPTDISVLGVRTQGKHVADAALVKEGEETFVEMTFKPYTFSTSQADYLSKKCAKQSGCFTVIRSVGSAGGPGGPIKIQFFPPLIKK